MKKISHYYKNMRVTDWRGYVGIAIFGLIFGGFPDLSTATVFLLTSCLYLAFSFSVNNCFDARCDLKKPDKNPIASGKMSFGEGFLFSISFAFLGIISSYIWFERSSFIIYLSMIFLSFFYSAPPLRFKNRPIIDILSHGSFFGFLLFLYGISVASPENNIMNHTLILVCVSIFVYSMVFELINHLEDFDEDLSSGMRTTACWLGKDHTKKLLKFLFLIHWFLLMAILSEPILILMLISAGFILTTKVTTGRSGVIGRFSFKRTTDLCTVFVYLYISYISCLS
ncbi:MAG: prenyltransferase [Candidatus Syntropharchaeia archaeon]